MAKKEFKAFEFQDKAVKNTVKILLDGLNVMLNSPPSSGKTVMAAWIMRQLVDLSGKKIIFFVHLDNLFASTIDALQMFFNAGEYQGVTAGFHSTAKVYIVMSQTFTRRMKTRDWAKYLNPDFVELCVFDEAHRGEHDVVLQHIIENGKKIKVLGLSGTPKKPKNAKLPLALCYDHIENTVSEIELINMKRTVPPWLIIPTSDASKMRESVKKKGDDFDENEAAKAFMSDRKLCSEYVSLWQKHCKNTETLVFCSNIEHAIDTCKTFEEAGIKAKFFTGKPAYPKKPNKPKNSEDIDANIKYIKELDTFERHLQKYEVFCDAERRGWVGQKGTILAGWGKSFHILINVGVFTTGFDRDTIKTVILLRMTTSENLYLQMVGRGKRYLDGKDFYFLMDLGGNISAFGHPTIKRTYSLFVQNKKKGGGDAPLKICPKCQQSVMAVSMICDIPVFEDMKFVGICGHSFKKERVEYKSEFTLIQWGKMDAMNGYQASDFLIESKKTQVGDIFEYWKKRWEASKIKRAEWSIGGMQGKEPTVFSQKWLFMNIHKKFGVSGLVELAEDLNKDVDFVLNEVQRTTNLDVLGEYRRELQAAEIVPS